MNNDHAETVKAVAFLAIVIVAFIINPIVYRLFYRKRRGNIPFQGKEAIKTTLIFAVLPSLVIITIMLIMIGGINPIIIVFLVAGSLLAGGAMAISAYSLRSKVKKK